MFLQLRIIQAIEMHACINHVAAFEYIVQVAIHYSTLHCYKTEKIATKHLFMDTGSISIYANFFQL